MEIEAQEHSTVETNDEKKSPKRKRVPKKFSSSDESDKETTKKPKRLPKKITKKMTEESLDVLSSDEPEEESNYVFKKSKTLRLRDAYKTFEISTHNRRCNDAENLLTAPEIIVSDVTIVPAAGNSSVDANVNSASQVLEKMDSNNGNVDEGYTDISNLSLIDMGISSYINLHLDDTNLQSSCFQVLDIDSQLNGSNSSTGIPMVGEIIELSNPNSNMATQNNNLQDNSMEHNKQYAELNSKLDAVLSTLEGFKKIIIDLTCKILRLEELARKNIDKEVNYPLSEELSIPVKTPDAFTKNEKTLLDKEKAADNLVICN